MCMILGLCFEDFEERKDGKIDLGMHQKRLWLGGSSCCSPKMSEPELIEGFFALYAAASKRLLPQKEGILKSYLEAGSGRLSK